MIMLITFIRTFFCVELISTYKGHDTRGQSLKISPLPFPVN